MLKKNLIISFLFVSICSFSQHKDYSSQNGFEILKGLLLKADKLEKTTDTLSVFFGENPLEVQRFNLNSEITVQVSCNGFQGKFENARANYTIEIASDQNGKYLKLFAKEIYDYWIDKEEWHLESYNHLPASTHLFYEKGNYVMYIWPENNNPGYSYLFYYDKKILRVTFNGFDQNAGAGGLSAFMRELVHFKFDKRTIVPEYRSYFDPNKFIDYYKENMFE